MKLHPKYCSYFALLVKALEKVPGDVLEMGTGPNSTFFLHWMCLEQGRQLHSYDNSSRYFDIIKACETDWHHVYLVDDWDTADIEREWGIAFVDHAPAIRRKDDIRRLADYASVILFHDSQGRSGKHYHYEEILPLFKHVYVYDKVMPRTTVVSNVVPVHTWGEAQ